MEKEVIPIITGPTAIGKTEVANRLAARINGELVCADRFQMYRDLLVGSCAPPEGAVAGRHLYGITTLDREPIKAGQYRALFALAAAQIMRRQKRVIVEGGGLNFIGGLLEKNREIVPGTQFRLIALTAEVDYLKERIRQRIGQYWEYLIVEVQELRTRNLNGSNVFKRAIGYREAERYLDGEISNTEALQSLYDRTVQLALDQLEFCYRKTGARIINTTGKSADQTVDNIVAVLNA